MKKTILLAGLALVFAAANVSAKPPVLTDQAQFTALQTQVTSLQAQVNSLATQLAAINAQQVNTLATTVAYICTNFISVQTAVTTPNPCSP